MKLLDSRRLFGRNLQTPRAGAVAEVEFEPGEDAGLAIAAWAREVRAVVPGAMTAVRRWRDGAALVIEGEHDQLLALTEVNEQVLGHTVDTAALQAALVAALEPPLRAIEAEARRRELPVLVDDAAVSIGLGTHSRVYPRDALPAVADVPWAELGRVPVGMVTGTNGKTTTVRLAGRMAALGGKVVGVAMTDGITVGGQLLHSGDYTGPEAARLVLRHPDVELAILETARGGILRRGLALDDATAGVVTNVSDDHLGLYGIDDVETMAEVKALVARAARTAVLNRSDARLRFIGETLPDVVWFGAGGRWAARDGWIVCDGARLLRVDEVAISFGGAAAYNVENSLGAAALAEALGVAQDAIVEGLRVFTSDDVDNPGRGNWKAVGGVQVLIDFAHNPDGVRAVMALVRTRRGDGTRLHVVLAQPGDRRDEAITAVARAIAEAAPDRVVLHDLTGYLRGREPGVVPALMRAELERAGVTTIEHAEGEAAALEQALRGAAAGDVVVLMPLLDSPGVRGVLERLA